ncbi:MAG TPA: hypothetical protein VJ602_12030, partial [Paludibacter sp.]|nr:hypothetical protein [Paludibacter sp.]
MKAQNFRILQYSALLILSCSLLISCRRLSVENANRYYNELRMDKALNFYKELVATNKVLEKDKPDIYLKISKIFYKAFNQTDSAIYYAEKGMSMAGSVQKTEFVKQLANYSLAARHYDLAWNYSSGLLNSMHNKRDSLSEFNMMLNIKVADVENGILLNKPVKPDKLDSAVQLANLIYQCQPESPANNEKRLELFLLKGSWKEALSALRDYYFIDDDIFIRNFYQERLNKFNSLTGDLTTNQLTQETKISIIGLLGDFRFYDIALVLSKFYGIENVPEIKETLAYANFRKAFERAVSTHYAEILINRDSDRRFKAQLDSCYRYLWSKIKECSGKPYNFDSLIKIAGRNFGMNCFLKEKGSYHVYILGESIYQNKNNVEQYGYKASYDYYLVDHIVGTHVNGYYYDYFDWGGWSENGLVMENRRIVLDGAINEWEKISDKTTVQIEAITKKLALKDDSLLLNTDIADLPGLRTRFEYKALCSIRDSIQNSGVNGTELRKKAIANIRLNDYLSGSIAHEGRHVIDTKYNFAGNDHVQTEFTANLSSVVFAPVPQLPLSRLFIYDPESKDPTGHKNADSKIVQGFLQWM